MKHNPIVCNGMVVVLGTMHLSMLLSMFANEKCNIMSMFLSMFANVKCNIISMFLSTFAIAKCNIIKETTQDH
jgi:hypothetical protein